MKFTEFKDHLLLGLGGIAVAILFWMANSVSTLNTNVGTLNTNVAVIVEKVANHEKRIEKLESK